MFSPPFSLEHACLPPAIPYSLLFTGGRKRTKSITSNPEKAPRGPRAHSRDTLHYDATGRGKQASAARDQAEMQAALEEQEEEEIAKKARYDQLTSVLSLSKAEYREMRRRPFFSMLRTSNNPHYWRKESELIMSEIYVTASTKVAPQKVLNLETLGKKEYFSNAVWVMKKLGLARLFGIQQDYHEVYIQQFYATVVFGDPEDDEEDDSDDIILTWMTGAVKCVSSIKRLAELLGYDFKGAHTPVGARMHHEGTAYDKQFLAPLYEEEESIGTNKDLKRDFNIMLRMFRCNIAPQAGNVDAIRGGLVNLLYQAYKAYHHGPHCKGYEIDVIDFIKCEIFFTMTERRKIPVYGPYIMMLILDKVPKINVKTRHPKGSLQVLKIHTEPKKPYAQVEAEAAPSCRRKNADPPRSGKAAVMEEEKKLTWFQRNILCMTVAVHKENHEAYKERRELKKMLLRLQENAGIVVTPPLDPSSAAGSSAAATAEPSVTLSYDEWNKTEFPWADFSEISSAPSSSRNTG